MMQALKDICALVLSSLRSKNSRPVYELWFKDMKLCSMTGTEAVFSINSDLKQQVLTTQYLEAVTEALQENIGFPLRVSFISTEKEEGMSLPTFTPPPPEKEPTEEEAVITPSMDNPGIVEKYTFENFIEGDSNKFARSACMAVAFNPFSTYNPLFIYGQSGLGKTHLLYAITNEIKRNKPEVKIIYKKGEEYTNDLVKSLHDGNIDQFHKKYRSADVLLIDDIQFIAGKESTQEAFFHTFEALHENEKQIILTSDRPPKEIKLLEDRLRTRFEWGLVADIQPPSIELRTAIIQKKAESLPMPLNKEIVDFLAVNLKENIRQIEGVIKKIAAVSVLSATPITKSMCERIVKEFTTGTIPPAMLVDNILNCVSERFHIPVEEIKGRRRNNGISLARHVCIYIIHEMTDYSLNYIGDIFGRDHTTVLNSIKKVEEEKNNNKEMEGMLGEIMLKVRS